MPFMTIVICLCTLEAYIANNMDPDQTAPLGAVWSGLLVVASDCFYDNFYKLTICSRFNRQTFSEKKWQDKG